MIITIDGPAGAGKSTAARKLAQKLRIAYLDTGATYRAVTLKALRNGVDLTDQDALTAIARQIDLRLAPNPNGTRVIMDGRDVTEEIRSVEVTENARHVAGAAAARQVLAELQRRLGRQLGDFVAEGRDQGSVVFPEADVKFYLVAEAKTRAQRRHRELVKQGQSVSLQQVLAAIERRDRSDRNRQVAPLVKPDGAIVIDNTDKTIEQTAAELAAHVEAAR